MTKGRSHLRIQKVQAETMPINNVYLKLLLNYICCVCLLANAKHSQCSFVWTSSTVASAHEEHGNNININYDAFNTRATAAAIIECEMQDRILFLLLQSKAKTEAILPISAVESRICSKRNRSLLRLRIIFAQQANMWAFLGFWSCLNDKWIGALDLVRIM